MREWKGKKDTWASSLAVLKKLLLNTKKRVQNDEHPACSFHIEEIAFGNIELAGMMKYTNPPPHMHANMHIFAHIHNVHYYTIRIQKRSYSQGQSWAHITCMCRISFRLCAWVGWALQLLKQRKWKIGANSEREKGKKNTAIEVDTETDYRSKK